MNTWDMGDAEPDVTAVWDYTDPGGSAEGWGNDSARWGRTAQGEWKGYKDGGKVYLEWAELVRRWGPLTRADQ